MRVASLRHGFERLAEASRYFPLTPLGTGMLLTAAALYWGFARDRQDLTLSFASLLLVFAVLLAFFTVFLGAWRLRSDLDGAQSFVSDAGHIALTVGQAPTDTLWVHRSGLGRLLEVRWHWLSPPGVRVDLMLSEVGWVERAVAYQRGQSQGLTRRFVCEDALGLARIVFDRRVPARVRQEPAMASLKAQNFAVHFTDGELHFAPKGQPLGERVDMRRYTPGDPLRLIHWKMFARRRVLMVRTPERALSEARRLAMYLVSAFGDEASAAVLLYMLRYAYKGDWVCSADGQDRSTSRQSEAEAMLLDSRAHRDRPSGQAAGLKAFMRAHASDSVLLFLPAQGGPWVRQVLEAVQGDPGRVTAILAHDGIAQPSTQSRAERLLKRPEPENPLDECVVSQADLNRLVARLEAGGMQLHRVCRNPGSTMASRALPEAER